MEDFYVVLPSNVHWPSGPPNKTGDYKTPLPKPLELSQDSWQVALTEISFPQSWTNGVPSIYFDFTPYYTNLPKLSRQDGEIKSVSKRVSAEILPAPQGEYYKNIGTVIRRLNDRRKGDKFKGQFKYRNHRAIIMLHSGESIELNKLTQELLGFEKNVYKHNGQSSRMQTFIGGRQPDIRLNMYNLFVYCNLVQETLVGDVLVPLLRTIAIKEENDGKYISIAFQHLRYCKLASSFFQHIHVQITTDSGKPVEFNNGKIIATLHFRQVK